MQNLFRAERIAAVHNSDRPGELGEEERLFHGRIAAADHQHVLASVEKAVARGAGRDAVAAIFLLTWKTEPASLRPGADDDGLRMVERVAIAGKQERRAGKIDRNDSVLHDLGPNVERLGPHLLHEPRPLDDVREARIIFHFCRGGELSAGLDTLDENRAQHGPRCINRSRVTGRAGADDHEPVVA